MDCGFYHCPNAPWNWLNALVHVGLLVFGRLDKKVTNNLNIKVQFMCVTDRVCVNKSGLNAKKVSTCDNRGGTCYSVRALIWVRGRVYAKLVNNQTFFFSDDGALYFAVVLMGSCFGPAIGFIGGALQLTLWVEGDANKPDGIDRVETFYYLSLIQVS